MYKSVFFAIGLALAGCGSDAKPTPATVSGATPDRAFLARTLDVHLSGSATNWTDQTSVSFGDGITVNKVTAASPTALVANITVMPSAALGTRDITITDAGAAEPYKMAFSVVTPISVTVSGQLAQGSIATVHVDNHDLENLFDTTAVSTGLFSPPTFTNIAIAAPAGTTLIVGNVTPFAVDATLTIDVTAQPVKADLDVVSGPMGGTQVHFPSPGVLDLKARSAAQLPTSDTTAMNAAPYDSALFTFTPSAATLLVHDLSIAGDNPDGQPAIALLPKSGAFKDLIAFSATQTFVSTAGDPYYAIVWDSSGTAGYGVTITRKETAATAVTEKEANNDKTTAQDVASLPAVVQGGSLAGDTDEDWFKLTIAAGDVGKKVHVMTFAGDPMTDTLVDVLSTDGTTSLGGPSDDLGFHEDFTSKAITTAGTYYVKVSASPMFVAAHATYQALIRLE